MSLPFLTLLEFHSKKITTPFTEFIGHASMLLTLSSVTEYMHMSVNSCVQISVDAFIDDMNGEKILAQNEN